jgi:LCP family protein required for cell wall assembly
MRHERTRLAVIAAVLVVTTFAGTLAVGRMVSFLAIISGSANPITIVQQQFAPAPGSVPWKLKHNQQVNLLLLGYGGAENDSPYLTDTMMAVTLDPASKRVVMTSIPRDIWMRIDAWPPGDPHAGFEEKVNDAFAVGTDPNGYNGGPGKLADYTGRNGGGRLAEHDVERLTGIKFDKYAAVDFKAFREVVDALGGVDICLDSKLDDFEYPDYHNGYVPGGIHFKAGCQHVDGEQALRLARSRHAVEPEQATDFARAHRQQLVLAAIKKQAVSVNGVTKAPQLMRALEQNFKTDMDVNDMKAVYDWTGALPDNSILHLALTNQDFLDENTCGPVYTLCPQDPTYQMIHDYLQAVLIDPKALAERAPVQVAYAGVRSYDLGDRMSRALEPLGLQLAPPVHRRYSAKTVVYDYSGGRYPGTAAWLGAFFKAPVQPATPATIPAAAGQTTTGLVVVLGQDFDARWFGRA